MRSLAPLAFAALLPSAVWAQSGALGSIDRSRGVTLAPTSAASSEEATSLTLNPAGLSRVGPLNAWYVHERAATRALDADALFVATSVADLVGVGLEAEWLRPWSDGAHRRFGLGLAVGPRLLSGGASVRWLTGGAVQGLTTVDLGLQSRPLPWLALGALVRNLGAPSNASTTLEREWTFAVGLRPFGERLSLGVDWSLAAGTLGRLQYTLDTRPWRGLRLSAGLSHGLSAPASLAFQAGVGVDFDHLGSTLSVGTVGGSVDWQFAARASVERFASIVPARRIAVVSLGDLGDGGPTVGSLLGFAAEDRFLRLLQALERARLDPELAAVVLRVEGAGLGLARADELGAAVRRLRQAGKKVFAYVLSATDADYLTVSACDGIYAAPEAMMLVDGLRASVLYFGGAAELVGVGVDVARVGAFKNTPDQFTRRDMSREQRESIDAYLDATTRTVAERVVTARGMSPERWQAALDEGLKPTRRERELGTIDGVLPPAEFEAVLRREVPGATISLGELAPTRRDARWSGRQRIAVIPVLGTIAGGQDTPSPLGGRLAAGAQSFLGALASAVEDPRVAAIVVRVDSGGGDGLASDLMYRAILEAKKQKPVVSSMGDAAASGGYYVAMGAEEVFASPTTLTGSIGVFFAKPSVRGLAEKLGVSQVSVSRGKLAGLTELFDPWTPEQRAAAQRWVDDFYDTFISEVATSRRLSKEQVHRVAQGRVWSGSDALERGLVDRLGGLWDAIASARARAGLGADEDVEVTLVRPPGALPAWLGAFAPAALLEHPVRAPATAPVLEALARQLGASAWLLDGARPQARLEWDLAVE